MDWCYVNVYSIYINTHTHTRYGAPLQLAPLERSFGLTGADGNDQWLPDGSLMAH